MQITLGALSARALLSALALSCTTLVLAAGCGGGDESSNPSPKGGAGGEAGEDSEAGKGGSSAASNGGATGAEAGEAGTSGAAGAADTAGAGGEGGALEPPAQNNSAVSFVSTGVVSKSKNFILVSGLGESLGGTVGSKQSKSLKYTYIPGVIAASSP